jgi:hypothetical protein
LVDVAVAVLVVTVPNGIGGKYLPICSLNLPRTSVSL